ncbi:MAG: hypothetical protein AAB512_04825 [Patescibacteria group bacterium]
MRAQIFIVIFLSVFLSACLPNLGGASSGDQSKPGLFLKGRAGKNFPALPLYPKAKIVESYGSDSSYGASAITDDNIAKVVEFYNNSLGSLGWEFKFVQNSETNYSYDIKNNKQAGTVTINTAADGKKTAITLSVSPR